MNEGEIRIVRLRMPKKRTYFAYGHGDWTRNALAALSKIKPEEEAVIVPAYNGNAKETVKRLHSLASRYGFEVTCRTMRDTTVIAWVKKPGIDKNVLGLWEIK